MVRRKSTLSYGTLQNIQCKRTISVFWMKLVDNISFVILIFNPNSQQYWIPVTQIGTVSSYRRMAVKRNVFIQTFYATKRRLILSTILLKLLGYDCLKVDRMYILWNILRKKAVSIWGRWILINNRHPTIKIVVYLPHRLLLISTWFEYATSWSGVRRATIAPRNIGIIKESSLNLMYSLPR